MIQPEKGYGKEGMPPAIPPNAFLVFDVNCTGISDEPPKKAKKKMKMKLFGLRS